LKEVGLSTGTCFKVTKMAKFDRSYTTVYQSAIVTIALSSTISELIDVEEYRHVET